MPKTLEFNIRLADQSDSFDIAQLSKELVKETGLKKTLGFDWKEMVEFADKFTANPNGVVFLAEVDEEIVGFVAGILSPTFFNPSSLQAAELGWYVSPEFRRSRIASELHQKFEDWARGFENVRVVQMMHINTEDAEAIGNLYKSWGYTLTETSYVKELK